MKHFKLFISLCPLLAFFCAPSFGQSTVATCPTAVPGTVWPSGQWLPSCPTVVYAPVPLPATAIVADMGHVPTCCPLSWMLASNVKSTDQVWGKNTAFPTGQWFGAVPPNFVLTTGGTGYTATAILSWTAPTTNTDGTPLTNLAGYTILSGPSPTALTKLAAVAAGTLTYTAIIGVGTTYFAAQAFNSATPPGVSVNSAVVSKSVAAPTTKIPNPPAMSP